MSQIFYIVFSVPVMKCLISQLSLPFDFIFYFLLVTLFVMSSHRNTLSIVSTNNIFFIFTSRASRPLKRSKTILLISCTISNYIYLLTDIVQWIHVRLKHVVQHCECSNCSVTTRYLGYKKF